MDHSGFHGVDVLESLGQVLGINITVGVQFGRNAPDARAMQIEIVGAGIEFRSS